MSFLRLLFFKDGQRCITGIQTVLWKIIVQSLVLNQITVSTFVPLLSLADLHECPGDIHVSCDAWAHHGKQGSR
jgi:hypothetical protein